MLHNFSIRESLFTLPPSTNLHVPSKFQSMIACCSCNICFIISILQLKVRDGREWWRKTVLVLFVCKLRHPIKTYISCIKIPIYFSRTYIFCTSSHFTPCFCEN